VEAMGEADRVLLSRSAAGDRRAFGVLFDRHSRAVTRYAWALLSDQMDVEEIVQDTFVTAWEKAARVSVVETSALPWLLVTCRYHALNLRRKRVLQRTDELPEQLADVAANEDQEVAVQRLRWVTDEISALDPLDRRICELCLIDGRSYKDAAAIVGKSVGAVSKRLERARTRIRMVVSNNER
jgi:RNA polymerase sigma factor (sigma-70 family)